MKFNPEHEFAYELSCVSNPLCQGIAVSAMSKLPEYFWTLPASSSGHFHPKTSLGIGGLVRHVKSVFAVSEALLSHPSLYDFSADEKDEIRVAILVHDGIKQGFGSEPTHTLHDHPILPRTHLEPSGLNEQGLQVWDRICTLVESHMGPWNVDKKGESDIVLPLPESPAQKFVHMCDYLASRKEIEVDVFNRTAQEGYKAHEKKATDAQIDFLTKLVEQAVHRKLDISPWENIQIKDVEGNTVLGMKHASTIIDELKALLSSK